MKTLAQAREERMDQEIDKMISDRMKARGVKLETVGPSARVKLRGILKKYARSAHPFRECVRDTTPVETASGPIAIKNLKPGDLVWSFNGEVFELQPVVWASITRTNAELMKLTLDGGREIVATPDHRFMREDGSWAELQELRSRDLLFGAPTRHSLSRACLAVALASANAVGDDSGVIGPEMALGAGDSATRLDFRDSCLSGVMSSEGFGDLNLSARGHQGQNSAYHRSGSVTVDTPFPFGGVVGDLARRAETDVADTEDRLESFQGFNISLGSNDYEVGRTQPITITALRGSAVKSEATFALKEPHSPSKANRRQVVDITVLEEREDVWDIEVQGNHNFVALGTVAHNCVRDNLSRFGPGRTEAVCATLKDTIKGTTKWRKGGSNMSESDAVIDADVLLALDAMSEIDLQEIFLEVRALEEHGTREASTLLDISGRSELERWGVGHVQLADMEGSS